jgi:hypothetical protein
MYRIVASRGTGKTRALMEEAYKNNGLFVCQNPHRMYAKADTYGFHGLKIISFRDFIDEIQPHTVYGDVQVTGYKHEYDCDIYVDELEGLVNFICLNKFKGYTISDDVL